MVISVTPIQAHKYQLLARQYFSLISLDDLSSLLSQAGGGSQARAAKPTHYILHPSFPPISSLPPPPPRVCIVGVS